MNTTFFWYARFITILENNISNLIFVTGQLNIKLLTLMTFTNKIILLNVSKYIYYAFLLRSSNTL